MAIKRYNATLRNLEYKLRKYKDELPMYLGDIIRENEDAIVSMIANKQLYEQGINGRGESIMSYMPYQPRTIKYKQKKGQPTSRVTLRDTGDFHESFRVVVDSEGFYITSDDEKAKWLIKKYGNEIFRLTDDNFNELLREKIRVGLQNRIKNAIKS